MKQFLNLVKNENIKTWKQVGYRVLLIIFAVAIVLTPIVTYLTNNIFEYVYDDPSYYEDYLERANEYINMKEYGDAIYFTSSYYSHKFYGDNNISTGGPEYSLFFEDLQDAERNYRSFEFLKNGVFTYGELFNCGWGYEEVNSFYVNELGIPEDFEYDEDPYSIMYKSFEKYITKEVIEYLYGVAKDNLDAVCKEILSFEISEYYQKYYDYAKSEYDYYADLLKQLENPTDNAIDSVYLMMESKLYYVNGLKYLIDNKCEYGGWEFLTVSEIIQRASNYLSQLSIATEDEYYLDNSLRSRYDSYNDYVNYMHEQRTSTRDALKMTAYSLEHNIPVQGVVSESAKSSWKNNINSLINISTYIMIAMSVLIISNEYTSGSIRLLLIRPRKRYKILLSKLVSLAIYWGMMLLGSFVITFVLNMILYKSSDLLVPELNIVGGNVVEINAIVSMLIYTFTKIASVLPMLLLSFLLAIVMRRAALPIVLPVMIQGVSSVAQIVSMTVIEIDGMEFIKYLPFAYSDMTVFFTNPVGMFMYNNSFDIGTIFGNIFTYDMVSQFIPLIGIIYLVAFIAIEITLSFIIFIKQQIKN